MSHVGSLKDQHMVHIYNIPELYHVQSLNCCLLHFALQEGCTGWTVPTDVSDPEIRGATWSADLAPELQQKIGTWCAEDPQYNGAFRCPCPYTPIPSPYTDAAGQPLPSHTVKFGKWWWVQVDHLGLSCFCNTQLKLVNVIPSWNWNDSHAEIVCWPCLKRKLMFLIQFNYLMIFLRIRRDLGAGAAVQHHFWLRWKWRNQPGN